MKQTKEDVYISLKGKTKEELTDLWEILDNSGEKQYSSLKEFINESDCWDYFIFEVPGVWTLAAYKGSRKEVTIEQLKELLNNNKKNDMRKDLTLENVQVNCKGLTSEQVTNISDIIYYKNGIRPILTKDGYITHNCESKKTTITYDKFMELFTGSVEVLNEEKYIADLTLKQQLQKAEAEVKRLRKAIEDSKIKNGDWCTFWDYDKNKFIIAKYQGNKFVCMSTGDYLLNCEKITDPDLLESLNKLF